MKRVHSNMDSIELQSFYSDKNNKTLFKVLSWWGENEVPNSPLLSSMIILFWNVRLTRLKVYKQLEMLSYVMNPNILIVTGFLLKFYNIKDINYCEWDNVMVPKIKNFGRLETMILYRIRRFKLHDTRSKYI